MVGNVFFSSSQKQYFLSKVEIGGKHDTERKGGRWTKGGFLFDLSWPIGLRLPKSSAEFYLFAFSSQAYMAMFCTRDKDGLVHFYIRFFDRSSDQRPGALVVAHA